MSLELHKIKRSMHHDVITSFWTMLSELESKARSDNDAVLKHQVEGWYKQWNRMTGDDKRPSWTVQPQATVIYCKEKLQPGGCQLHNLQCGWPACNNAVIEEVER